MRRRLDFHRTPQNFTRLKFTTCGPAAAGKKAVTKPQHSLGILFNSLIHSLLPILEHRNGFFGCFTADSQADKDRNQLNNNLKIPFRCSKIRVQRLPNLKSLEEDFLEEQRPSEMEPPPLAPLRWLQSVYSPLIPSALVRSAYNI